MTDADDNLAKLLHTTAEVFWMTEGGMQRPIREWTHVTPVERQYWVRLADAIRQAYDVRPR